MAIQISFSKFFSEKQQRSLEFFSDPLYIIIIIVIITNLILDTNRCFTPASVKAR